MTGWSKSAEAIGSKPAIKGLRPHGLISNAWRWGAGVISAGAGLVSILSYTHSLKSKFEADSLAAGTLAVRWVRVTPMADTAASIGDTIQLAVTATDSRGNALLGAPTLWNSVLAREAPAWIDPMAMSSSRTGTTGDRGDARGMGIGVEECGQRAGHYVSIFARAAGTVQHLSGGCPGSAHRR